MEQSIFCAIRTNYHSCTSVQKKLAHFVLMSPDKVILYSVCSASAAEVTTPLVNMTA